MGQEQDPSLTVHRAGSRRWFCLPYTLVGQRVLYCELFAGRLHYACLAGLQTDRTLLLQVEDVTPNL